MSARIVGEAAARGNAKRSASHTGIGAESDEACIDKGATLMEQPLIQRTINVDLPACIVVEGAIVGNAIGSYTGIGSNSYGCRIGEEA